MAIRRGGVAADYREWRTKKTSEEKIEGEREREIETEEEGGRLVAVKARKGKEQKSNGDFGESGGC